MTASSEYQKLDSTQFNSDIRIIDSDGAEMGPYCGATSPPTFTSVTNKLTIEFTSDVAKQGGGFEAEWSKVQMSGSSKVSQNQISSSSTVFTLVCPVLDNKISESPRQLPVMLPGQSGCLSGKTGVKS